MFSLLIFRVTTFCLLFKFSHQNEITAIISQCPVPGNGQRIASSDSITSYWICLPEKAKLMTCPPKSFFNPSIQDCQLNPSVHDCHTSGRFSDPRDCTKYFECVGDNGTFINYSYDCPLGSHYDEITFLCLSGCCSTVLPVEPTTTVPSVEPGKDIYHNFKIGYITHDPDGVSVEHVLTVNGKFPGVEIRGKLNDMLHVNVENHIMDRDLITAMTSIHWHGLYFRNGLGIYDGAEGTTQCGIAYNKSMQYDFPLDQSGTFWWHSHVGTQYTEGLYGALIVEDDNDPYINDYEVDSLVFMLGDWYHQPAKDNLGEYMSLYHIFPRPNSALINGNGHFPCEDTFMPCSQKEALVYEVSPGSRHRIRIINVSTFWMFKFYIEGHQLEVIEVDGILTRQVPCDYIIMSSGQRYSVIVSMNVSTASKREFYIHSVNANGDTHNGSSIHAILRYTDSYKNLNHDDVAEIIDHEPIGLDERTLIPHDETILAPTRYDQHIYLELADKIVDGIHYLAFNDMIHHNVGPPVLYQMVKGQEIDEGASPLYIEHGNLVEVELYNANAFPHPFHLHGHSFWVVASGPHNSGKTIYPYPHSVRRDTVTVEGNATIIFRFEADNPGAWLFHCHINWHHLIGSAVTFIEGKHEVQSKHSYPQWAKDICVQSGKIPFTCPATGNFQDPADSTQFFNCTEFEGHFYHQLYLCPPGYSFSTNLSTCIENS